MSGFFKKALGAFVEMDESEGGYDPLSVDDLDAEAKELLAAIEAGASTAPPEGSAYAAQAQQNAEVAATAPTAAPVSTGASFEEIYAQAGVPASPYSAEMLLKVAEGLRALPIAQARAAVTAMDSADDRWTVGDVLLDAQRKIGALQSVEGGMEAQRNAAEVQYTSTIENIDTLVASTVEEINKQITELEALLREARETATVERAAALSDLEATRAQVSGEVARLQGEITRLGQVYEFLGEENV